jgi:hypothetical protein
MTKRRAPEGGYNFGNKRQYRRDVWGCFRAFVKIEDEVGQWVVRNCPEMFGVYSELWERVRGGEYAWTDPTSLNALLMPSLEGIELAAAHRLGIRQENIHVVDQNPAIVATITRKHGPCHAHGVTLDKALRRLMDAPKGKYPPLDIVNLDLTGCLSTQMIDDIKKLSVKSLRLQRAIVAVTMLRGREQGLWAKCIKGLEIEELDLHPSPQESQLMSEHFSEAAELCRKVQVRGTELSNSDVRRLRMIASALSFMNSTFGSEIASKANIVRTNYIRILRCGMYRSTAGSQTMLWAVFEVRSVRAIDAMLIAGKVLIETFGPDAERGDWHMARIGVYLLAKVQDIWIDALIPQLKGIDSEEQRIDLLDEAAGRLKDISRDLT